MACAGNADDHCCYFDSQPCQFLVEYPNGDYVTDDGAQRRWVCSLRDQLGSWDAVYADDRYVTTIRPNFVRIGRPELDCGNWLEAGKRCAACGVVGDG